MIALLIIVLCTSRAMANLASLQLSSSSIPTFTTINQPQHSTANSVFVFETSFLADNTLSDTDEHETAEDISGTIDDVENNFVMYCQKGTPTVVCPRVNFNAEGHRDHFVDTMSLVAGDWFYGGSKTECQIFEGTECTDIQYHCPRFRGKVTIMAKDSEWESYKCWQA